MVIKRLAACTAGFGLLMSFGAAWALDPPHGGPMNPQICEGCHVTHNAAGAQITSVNGNANLCISCHTAGGTASGKPFDTTMQATPGTSGTSHRWDTSMAAGVPPLNLVAGPGGANNPYGLRVSTELSSPLLRGELTQFGGVITCSVCHDEHSQAVAAWDPFAGPYTGLLGGDSGAASAAGTATTLIDSTKASFWTANAWQNYYVKIISTATGTNTGQVRQISSNSTTQLTVTSAFPAATQAGDKYEIIGRRYQRTADDINQMCEDCHYYRTAASGQTGVETWTGKTLSHPIQRYFVSGGTGTPVADPTQYNLTPLEPASASWAAQQTLPGSLRYPLNGGADNNVTNNMVFDVFGNVRCLSCHGMHYTDSNAATLDQP